MQNMRMPCWAENGPSWRRNCLTGAGALLLLLLTSNAWSQTKTRSEPKAPASKPTAEPKTDFKTRAEPLVTVIFPDLDQAYKDLKLVFDLAGDTKGYQTFKETTDEFLVGIETGKPGGVRVYSTPDGLKTVISLPIKNEAEFKKFLENLHGLNVKTAPPPKPAQASQVPKDVQAKMKSLKLDPHERIVFGLYDGFVRYVPGEALIGNSLENVRLANGGVPADLAKGVSVAVRINGNSQTPQERRQALKKTREEMLGKLKKWQNESDAEFGHRKAITEQALTDLGNLLAEASQARMDWVTSHEKKQARYDVVLKADPGSALAKRIERIGKTRDEFAGVSKEGCVAWATINMPLDERRQESIKAVSRHGRAAANDRIETNARNNSKKANFTGLSDLISDIADDVAGMPEFNGCLRTWSTKGGLTSVGAVKVADSSRVIEFLQKLKGNGDEGQTVKLKVTSVAGVDIHQVANPQWQHDYPELFDDEGSVYVGTGEKAIWYAVGEQGLDRLKQAIPDARGNGAKSEPGELEARLLAFAEVWDKIHSRRSPDGESGKSKKVKESVREKHPKTSEAVSVVGDLHLSKLAVAAFREGKDTVSMKLTSQGDTLTIAGEFDEGTLRFVGKALSQFVKDNLEE